MQFAQMTSYCYNALHKVYESEGPLKRERGIGREERGGGRIYGFMEERAIPPDYYDYRTGTAHNGMNTRGGSRDWGGERGRSFKGDFREGYEGR